jgi:hypothetical protein
MGMLYLCGSNIHRSCGHLKEQDMCKTLRDLPGISLYPMMMYVFIYLYWLVVDLPLWKIWKSVGMIIPNIWKTIPNRQPVYLYLYCIYHIYICIYLCIPIPIPWVPADLPVCWGVSVESRNQLLRFRNHLQDPYSAAFSSFGQQAKCVANQRLAV